MVFLTLDTAEETVIRLQCEGFVESLSLGYYLDMDYHSASYENAA